jgi:hypothetical protein
MRISKTKLTVGIIGSIIVLLLAAIGVLGWKYLQANKQIKDSARKTTSEILTNVGNLYEVPTDEEPTVALIQDKTKLQNQEFFQKAKNGDYLLVYQKNKQAIVYRKETNKLIIVAPISINDNAAKQNN